MTIVSSLPDGRPISTTPHTPRLSERRGRKNSRARRWEGCQEMLPAGHDMASVLKSSLVRYSYGDLFKIRPTRSVPKKKTLTGLRGFKKKDMTVGMRWEVLNRGRYNQNILHTQSLLLVNK